MRAPHRESAAPRLPATKAAPRTKEELAYEQLKALILAGELPKDEFLSQRKLAERVDTNLTTVRTALRQLENDGLIENVPQWGVRIPLETEERLRDLYFMRELLEVGAIRRLVQNRERIDLRTIRDKARRTDELARKLPQSMVEYNEAHYDFHMELARQSGSELLVHSLNRIHFRDWLMRHDVRLWSRKDLVNHQRMVDVIFSSPEKVAVAEIRNHIAGGLESELVELRKALTKAGRE
jgi:DNA-binding GntR family transcriptional regulator